MKIKIKKIKNFVSSLSKKNINPEINILSQKQHSKSFLAKRERIVGTTIFFVLINILLFFSGTDNFVIPDINTQANYTIQAPFTFNIYKTKEELELEKKDILHSIFHTVRYDIDKRFSIFENISKVEEAVMETAKCVNDSNDIKLAEYSTVKNLISDRAFKAFYSDTTNFKILLKYIKKSISDGIVDVKFVGNEKEKKEYLKKYRASDNRIIEVKTNYLEVLKVNKTYIISKNSFKAYEEVIVDIFTKIKNKLNVNEEFLLSTNDFLSTIIVPYIFYDNRIYEKKVEDEFSKISNVKGKVVKGLKIIGKGELVTLSKYQILKALKIEMEKSSRDNSSSVILQKILNITFFNLIILIFLINLSYFDFKGIITKKNGNYFAILSFFLLLSIISVVIYKTGNTIFSDMFRNKSEINFTHVDWLYLFPGGVVGMIVTQFFGLIIGIIFSLYFALFNALIWGANIEMFIYIFLVSVIISYSIRKVKYFSHYVLYISGVIFVSSVSVLFLFSSFKFELNKNIIIGNVVLVLISSILTVFFGMVLMIVYQRMSGIITPIKLLELSDMNHPLLKELSTKAPGTYHHSLLISQLAEASATVIGANSLLARVSSMYHDIGKIYKPEYFIENQKGINLHDRHKPSISVKIIKNHVKKGVEFANKYKLPQEIINGIVEHHGTTMVKYFYDKAVNETELIKVGDELKAKETFDEIEFKYPGPKPQSKITGIIMIADNFEAIIRTLKDKSYNSLYKTISEIVDIKIKERQLEECNLTFTDLDKIKKAMVKRASSFFHIRIDYKENEKKNEKKNEPITKS